jgi:3-polyprenyl-4-hydroxybenzoate decarboxylase
MTAITKAFDGSKALVANNIKDDPNARMYSNLYATQERRAKLLGVSE